MGLARTSGSETPAFCFQEALECREGRSKVLANIWNFCGVWFQPFLRYHGPTAALCSGDQERVGHGLTGHLGFRRDQSGKMRYCKNLPDEFRLGSRWRFENSRIFFRPRDHIGFRAGLKLAPYLANRNYAASLNLGLKQFPKGRENIFVVPFKLSKLLVSTT